MKGISDYLEFVRVRGGRDAVDARDLIISTDRPHLVGAIRTFAFTEVQENFRLEFLEKQRDPYFYAKANGYRIYITLFGGLTPLPNFVLEDKEGIHAILQNMVNYYANQCISDGMRREYADDTYSKPKRIRKKSYKDYSEE
ncbi:MAG: hypothetical protein IJX44_03705 [Bacteroidaceae bacterium]|nr:hypothetical protein [Bacteroidaceae bacterium]